MEFNRKDGMIYLGDESRPDAYVTWKLHDDVMHVDHTVVKPSLEGQGIAGQLTEKLIAFARENNYKINPICPYTVNYFNKRPELDDLKK